MKFKKILSGIAALAMAATIIPTAFANEHKVYESGLAIEESGETIFNIEAFYPYLNYTGYIKDASNAKDGQIWSASYWNSGSDTYSQTINVTNPGEYMVTFVCSQVCNNLSLMTLKIDDVAIFTNENAPTQKWTNIPTLITREAQPARWSDEHYYVDNLCKYEKVVELSEGTHTVFLDMPAGTGTTRCAGAIDTISFTKVVPTEPVAIPAEGGRFEVEDVFLDLGLSPVENQDANGGDLIYTTTTNVSDVSRQVTFAQSGYYEVHFPMHNQNEYTNFTDFYLMLGNMKLFDNTYNNGYNKAATGVFASASTWTELFDYSKLMYIEAGTYDLTLDQTMYMNRDAFVLDYIEFIPKDGPSALEIPAEGGKFDVEDVFIALGAPSKAIEGAFGDKVIFATTGRYSSQTLDIDIEEEGYYKIHLPMMKQDAYNNFTNVTLLLDGATMFKNTHSDDYTNVATDVRCTSDDWSVLYDYTNVVYLMEGEHQIKLNLQTNKEKDVIGFDYLQFEKLTTPEINVTDTKVTYDFEDLFIWASEFLVDDDNANGDKFVKMSDTKGELVADAATVTVANTGIYEVRFVTEDVGKNFSQVVLTIDGNTVISNVGSISHYTETEIVGHTTLLDYYANVALTAGSHDLKISYVKGATATPRHAVAFDTLSIEPVSAQTLPSTGGTFEAEDLFGLKSIYEDDRASGGSYVFNSWGSSMDENLFGTIDVETEGYYNVELLTTGLKSAVSAAVLYIDGLGVIYSSNNGVSSGILCDPAYPQAQNEVYNIYSHVADDPVFLTEGQHEIKLVYKPSNDGGQVVKYALDCIKLTPNNEDITYVSDLADLAEAPFYLDGEPFEWPVGVYIDGEFDPIENGEKYQITYASTNEDVLSFDANGNVTAWQPGYADLSIVLAVGGRTLATFEERVYVLSDDSNRYIRHAEFDGEKVTFEAVQRTIEENEQGFAAKAVVGVYDGDRLVCVKAVDLSDGETSYEAEISATAENSIKIFALGSEFELSPIWDVTLVQ